MALFGFRSLFSRLFVSVFLALVVFAISMFAWIQVVHNNSDALKHRAFARQIAGNIDPLLINATEHAKEGNRVQSRYNLVVIKKSFDFFDESLGTKIGLYDQGGQLILQTNDSSLPDRLPETSWVNEFVLSLWGATPHHAQVKTSTGFTIWYESRTPKKVSRFFAFFNLFTGTILLLGIMSLVLWVIAKNITRRLNEMSKQMIKMGEGDFSVRVKAEGNDEIALLAQGFNQSADKIEQLISANNLLLAHASHEFRTPITRMRLQTEMLAMLGDKLSSSDKPKFDKRLNDINRDLTGLNDLIESILLVSRLDAGHALQQMVSVDLLELTTSECQHYQGTSLAGQPINIEAQPKLLTHLIRNLLNNALIHGVPPISVYVYGCHSGDEALTIPSALLEKTSPQNTPEPTSQTQAKDEAKDAKKDKSLFGRFKKSQAPTTLAPNYAVLAVIDKGNGIPVDKRDDILAPLSA